MLLHEWQAEDGTLCRANQTEDGITYERRERGRGWVETSIGEMPLDDETPSEVLLDAVQKLLGDGYTK